MNSQLEDHDALFLVICVHQHGRATLGAIEGRLQAQRYCQSLTDYQESAPRERMQYINQAERDEYAAEHAGWLAGHPCKSYEKLQPRFSLEPVEWLDIASAKPSP